MVLRAGSATADITPEAGLASYWGDRPLEGSPGHELKIHAVCIECGDTLAALVSIDTLAVDRALALLMRERAALASGVPADNICIAATHSHSTPAVCFTFVAGNPPDALYQDLVVQRAAQAVAEAAGKMHEAVLYSGHCPTAGTEWCRRMIRPDGRAVMGRAAGEFEGWQPEGQPDRELGWAIFETPDGEPLAAIINWPVHNNACSAHHYHADLFGFVGDALGEKLGAEMSTVTLAGPCGDVAWLDPDDPDAPRGDEFARGVGDTIAANVMAARAAADAMQVADLRVARDVATIADRGYGQSTWCEDGCRGTHEQAAEFARRRYDPEREVVRERGETELVVEVQGIALGELAIVTNPAELFCEFGIRIKRESPFAVTMPVELANGYCGYVPYARSFEHGGYETHRTCWTSRLVPEAGDIITGRSLALLREMRGGS